MARGSLLRAFVANTAPSVYGSGPLKVVRIEVWTSTLARWAMSVTASARA